jgi:hypothetical protein
MKKILYIDDEADTMKMSSKFDVMREEGIETIGVLRVAEAFPQSGLTFVKSFNSFRSNNASRGVLQFARNQRRNNNGASTSPGYTRGVRENPDRDREYSPSKVATEYIEKYDIADSLRRPVEALELTARDQTIRDIKRR